MLKTEEDIEGDVYQLVKDSVLGKSVKGKVYRQGMRPDDARGEDIVVGFVGGVDDQFQTAEVNVNIYVPDMVTADGRRVRDMRRTGELQRLVYDFVEQDTSDYQLETARSPKVMKHEEIDQYCINVRLRLMNVAW